MFQVLLNSFGYIEIGFCFETATTVVPRQTVSALGVHHEVHFTFKD